jgi:hypothetical protein
MTTKNMGSALYGQDDGCGVELGLKSSSILQALRVWVIFVARSHS